MDKTLYLLHEAVQKLPASIPLAMRVDMVMTLFLWMILSARAHGPVQIPVNSQFDACHWAGDRHAGMAIREALRGIAGAQPELALNEVFRPERFGDLSVYASVFNSTGVLGQVMRLIGGIPPEVPSGAGAGMCIGKGDIYIRTCATLGGTPHPLPPSMLRLAVELLQPPKGAVIYDPACGCGNFLLTALADAENRHPGSQPMLLGQDTRVNELGMARMQLLAKDTPHHLLLSDPLALALTFPPASPQAPGRATTLAKADIVLAVVPERGHAWDYVNGGMEKLGRFPAGAPRNSRLAFFWQALACATPGSGKMAVFVPPDIFKHRDGDDLCGYLIHHRLLVAVIDLPESVRVGFAKPPVLLIIDRAAANRTRVAFISDRVRGAARIDLDGGHYDADRITAAFTAYQAERQPHPSLVTVPYSVMAVHHHSLLLETYIEAVP